MRHGDEAGGSAQYRARGGDRRGPDRSGGTHGLQRLAAVDRRAARRVGCARDGDRSGSDQRPAPRRWRRLSRRSPARDPRRGRRRSCAAGGSVGTSDSSTRSGCRSRSRRRRRQLAAVLAQPSSRFVRHLAIGEFANVPAIVAEVIRAAPPLFESLLVGDRARAVVGTDQAARGARRDREPAQAQPPWLYRESRDATARRALARDGAVALARRP